MIRILEIVIDNDDEVGMIRRIVATTTTTAITTMQIAATDPVATIRFIKIGNREKIDGSTTTTTRSQKTSCLI
jgi:hypothetical protein